MCFSRASDIIVDLLSSHKIKFLFWDSASFLAKWFLFGKLCFPRFDNRKNVRVGTTLVTFLRQIFGSFELGNRQSMLSVLARYCCLKTLKLRAVGNDFCVCMTCWVQRSMEQIVIFDFQKSAFQVNHRSFINYKNSSDCDRIHEQPR